MGWVSSNFFNNLRTLEISRSLLIFVTFKASIPKAQLILYFSVNDPLPMCGRAVVPRYGGGVCLGSMVFGLVCVLYGPISCPLEKL